MDCWNNLSFISWQESHKNAQLTCKLTAQKKAPNSLFSSDIFVIKLESDFFLVLM